MKIEIYEAGSEEWQSICAPVQREMTKEKGGIVLIFKAKKGEEAKKLNQFWNKSKYYIEECKKEIYGLECSELYAEYAERKPEVYFLAYQIFHIPSEYLFDPLQFSGQLVYLFGQLRIE